MVDVRGSLRGMVCSRKNGRYEVSSFGLGNHDHRDERALSLEEKKYKLRKLHDDANKVGEQLITPKKIMIDKEPVELGVLNKNFYLKTGGYPGVKSTTYYYDSELNCIKVVDYNEKKNESTESTEINKRRPGERKLDQLIREGKVVDPPRN